MIEHDPVCADEIAYDRRCEENRKELERFISENLEELTDHLLAGDIVEGETLVEELSVSLDINNLLEVILDKINPEDSSVKIPELYPAIKTVAISMADRILRDKWRVQ